MKLPLKGDWVACASKDETRAAIMFPYLHVTIPSKGEGVLYATNGRVAVQVPVDCGPEDVSGPITAEAITMARRQGDGTIHCTADGLTVPVRSPGSPGGRGRRRKDRPVDAAATLPRPKDDTGFPIPMRNGGIKSVIEAKIAPQAFAVVVNPQYLLDIAQALGAPDGVLLAQSVDGTHPQLHVWGAKNWPANTANEYARGAVMPMRDDPDGRGPREWTEAVAARKRWEQAPHTLMAFLKVHNTSAYPDDLGDLWRRLFGRPISDAELDRITGTGAVPTQPAADAPVATEPAAGQG